MEGEQNRRRAGCCVVMGQDSRFAKDRTTRPPPAVLCLDSKFRPGKMSAPRCLSLMSLCLDSKFRPGKMMLTPDCMQIWLCLDSKFRPGKISVTFTCVAPPLCLDSKFRPGKMVPGLIRPPSGLCLDSKFRPGKIPCRPACGRNGSFALIPNSGRAK